MVLEIAEFERSNFAVLGYPGPGGTLQSVDQSVADGINLYGTIAHGNELTITDSGAGLGVRENIKPLFVSLGSKTASSLGRDTTNWFYAGGVDDAVLTTGEMSTSVKIDVQVTGLEPTWGTSTSSTVNRDPNKPHILYVEKYYDFDYYDPYYRAAPNYRVASPAPSTDYTIIIDGVSYIFNSGGSPTTASVNTGIAAAINADGDCPVTADTVIDPGYTTLMRKVPEVAFTHSSPNMTAGGDIFNWKKYRVFTDYGGGNYPNSYFGADGFMYTEHQSYHPTGFYFTDEPTPFVWRTEEYNLVNSSAVDVPDADLRCYVDNVFLNAGKNLTLTKTLTLKSETSVASDTGVHQPRLDQIGYRVAGVVAAPNSYMSIGYLCEDDEFNSVYVGNNILRTSCTRLVRLPQTEWGSTECKFIYLNTSVPPENAYFFIRTGIDSWVSDVGLRN